MLESASLSNYSTENALTSTITMCIPPTMKSEENRLATFDNPNWKCTLLSKDDFAENGFFYTGRGDAVRCAFCKIELGGWEEEDEIKSEHQRWSPRCQFLAGFDTGNIPLHQNNVVYRRSVQDYSGISIRPNSAPEMDMTKKLRKVSVGVLGIYYNQDPEHREFSTFEERLNSFKGWECISIQSPEKLAQAGFFYTGNKDETVCFYCGSGISNWSKQDDPWKQHARWFSNCPFILLMKGHDYVQKACTDELPIITAEIAKGIVQNDKRLNYVPETKPDEIKLCKICCMERENTVFLPCGHIVGCATCAKSLKKCNTCFEDAKAFTYLCKY